MAAVTSCGFDIVKITPHALDTKRGYSRVYKAEKIKPQKCGDPTFKFELTDERKPISEMNGYFCVPADQVQYMLRYYNEELRRSCEE